MQIAKKVQLHKRSLFIALAILFLGALFLYALEKRNEEINGMMEVASGEEASYMLENLNDRLVFIKKDLVDKYGESPVHTHSQNEHWERTKHLIEANPFLQAINHIGPDRRIEYVSPLEPNKAVIGLKIEIAAPREALEKAASSHQPYLSRPFEIIQGKLGYSLMIPHMDDTFFEIVFTAESVFGRDSPFRRRGDIAIRVSDEDTLVFKSPEYEELLSGSIEYQKDGEGVILNRTIHLSAVPTDDLLSKSSQFFQILSVGSLVLAFTLLVVMAFVQTSEITKRKQAEDTLRESEERYRALLELSGEVGEAVVMLQDTDGKKAVHTFATGEWPRITGYSMEELLGMSWFELLQPDYREAALERYQRRIDGEVIPGLFELSIVRKDGTEVPVEITGGPTTYLGKSALVVYVRDITGPKKAEQEREKLIQELQETLQEVKTLSGLLPICAWCKKFRDDEGYWKSVEEYLGEHTGAKFTHGICPECAAEFIDRG